MVGLGRCHAAELAVGVDRLRVQLGQIAEPRDRLVETRRFLVQPSDREAGAEVARIEVQHLVPMAQRPLDVALLLGRPGLRLAPARLDGVRGHELAVDRSRGGEPVLRHEGLPHLLQDLRDVSRQRQRRVVAPRRFRMVLTLDRDPGAFQEERAGRGPPAEGLVDQILGVGEPMAEAQDAQETAPGRLVLRTAGQQAAPSRLGLGVAPLGLEQPRQLDGGGPGRRSGRRATQEGFGLVGTALADKARRQTDHGRAGHAGAPGVASLGRGRGHVPRTPGCCA